MKNAISLTLLVPLLCSSEPEHDIQGQLACNKGYGTVYEGGLRLRAIVICVHAVCTVVRSLTLSQESRAQIPAGSTVKVWVTFFCGQGR